MEFGCFCFVDFVLDVEVGDVDEFFVFEVSFWYDGCGLLEFGFCCCCCGGGGSFVVLFFFGVDFLKKFVLVNCFFFLK